MTLREEARKAVANVKGSTYYIRWLDSADAASDIWEPLLEEVYFFVKNGKHNGHCGNTACQRCYMVRKINEALGR